MTTALCRRLVLSHCAVVLSVPCEVADVDLEVVGAGVGYCQAPRPTQVAFRSRMLFVAYAWRDVSDLRCAFIPWS